jgi:hypothetical protein
MVRWNSPRTLFQAALSVGTSAVFEHFADKREVQAGLSGEDFRYASDPAGSGGDDPFWFDFVADVGDGFDSTYTIAWLLAQERLALAWDGMSHETERGRLLAFGGDQVYPAASWDRYRDKFTNPYTAALPFVEEPGHPDLFAVPGNHDWYDGLTSFMRLFCQQQWIGGWRTRQHRSYFAIQLPRRWWLWGIDIQLDTYIDSAQLAYFERVAKDRLEQGDRVILVTSKPSWTRAGDMPEPQSWHTLTYFEEKMIREPGGVLALTVTGDLHHYCHYEAEAGCEPRHRVTCGGGGAYLYGTHSMPETLSARPHGSDHGIRYRRVATFPDLEESRRLARGLLRQCNPLRREPLGTLTGSIYALFALVLALGVKDHAGNLLDAVRGRDVLPLLGDSLTIWAVLLSLLLLLWLYAGAEADPGHRGGARTKRWGYALAHTLAHLVPIFTATLFVLWALSKLDLADGGFWAGYLTAALVFLFGYWWGRSVVAVYQYLANRSNPRQHINDVFAAQSIEDYKGFLRFRIDPSGELTVFPVGVRQVVDDWRAKPAGSGDELLQPWFEPASGEPPRAELIEEPFGV